MISNILRNNLTIDPVVFSIVFEIFEIEHIKGDQFRGIGF